MYLYLLPDRLPLHRIMTNSTCHTHPHLITLLAMLFFFGSITAAATEIETTRLIRALHEQLTTGEALTIRPTPDWPRLRLIYQNYGHRLLWHDAAGRIGEAGSALQRYIINSTQLGLDPDLYHAQNLTQPPLAQARQIVRNDLLLTDGFLRLSRHLAQGQIDPGTVDPLWKIPVEHVDSVQLLDRAVITLAPIPVLESLSPNASNYRRLLNALSAYRQIAERGGWPPLPEAPLIRPGERHDLIPLLRQRLEVPAEHEQEENNEATFYDPSLQQAVRQFQRSHGLKQDGIIGAHTRAAMNVPVEQRIAQIESNLERWRWLPQQLGDRYILVNIGGYLVQLVEHDQVKLEKHAIIGSRLRSTPSFTTRVTHLSLNPPWTVPRRIAVEDLLPEQRRDSEYLLRKNIQIQRREGEVWVIQDPAMINWGEYNKYNFPFQLRQSPGDGNSLGRIKFHMPNPYDIYLHDTPAQGLFGYPVRDFSSGCVRVQDIRGFVLELLAGTDLETATAFTHQLESRESSYFRLPQPIEVYLVYFTTWVDGSGDVQFRPDIYNLDRPLIMSLQQQHPAQGNKLAHRDQAENSLCD